MRKIFFLFILLSGLFLLLPVSESVCETENPGGAGTAQSTNPPVEPAIKGTPAERPAESSGSRGLTREEILLRLNGILRSHMDVVPFIPGLAGKKEETGFSYEYKGVDLEELDKDSLLYILRAANRRLSWKSYQRMQRQLKDLQQIQEMNRMQRMQRQLRLLRKQ
ncbi:MAG: hypothetical protein DRP85_02415 [Candidatus Makaraimicrobium thalassicum]|nr:MAG: hypothetical protein DRP85_02415 [Candidatus Omnitrophota bacterium]